MQLRYRFRTDDGIERHFDVALDDRTLALRLPPREGAPPAWAALDNERCPNCPLRAESSPQCPVALALDPVIAAFHDAMKRNEHKVAYAIPSPARREQKGWVLDAVPLVAPEDAPAQVAKSERLAG